jgi:hypothetical protein
MARRCSRIDGVVQRFWPPIPRSASFTGDELKSVVYQELKRQAAS